MDVAAICEQGPEPRKGSADESFSTDSTCSIPNDDETTTTNNNNCNVDDDDLPRGPFSGFRRRRRERQAIEQELEKAIPERLIEPDFESLRAGTISVTVVKNESNSYGMGLAQSAKNTVKIDALVDSGLLYQSPLREGDVLITVNHEPVTEYRPVMLRLMKMDGPVTISVETPQGNPAVVQAFCRKPHSEEKVGIEFAVVDHTTTQNDLCGDLHGSKQVTTTKLLQIQDVDPNGFLGHSKLQKGDFVLAINDTPFADKTAEEAASMVAESKTTLNIVALNPKLAQQHCSPTRAQRWLRKARRTGVGVAGGTMLGLGLIMIPLPLPPPFGEVLVAGGVTVLGTEFEAPKRVVRNARNALLNAVSKDDEKAVTEQLKQMESAETNTDNNNDEPTNQQPVVLRQSFFTMAIKDNQEQEAPIPVVETTTPEVASYDIHDCWSEAPTVHDASIDNMYSGKEHTSTSSPSSTRRFLKNVGRNVVLPFLDHVVGDKNQERAQESPSSVSPNAAETNKDSETSSDKETEEVNGDASSERPAAETNGQ